MGAGESEFAAELYRRVRYAVLEAERVVARSRALTTMRRVLAEEGLLVRRCAWCGRFTAGDDWVREDELPRFVPKRASELATHTICTDCQARLAREGKSVSTAQASTREEWS